MVRADALDPEGVARLQRAFEAKARAELKAADALLGRAVAVLGAGDMFADVVLIKGTPSADDRRARRALAGPDGEAALKALAALGLDPDSVWALCSRPVEAEADLRARRVELVIEAIDPRIVIALDAESADDLAAAFGLCDLPPGRPVSVRGRTLGSVGDLGASLADTREKAKVWARFKEIGKAGVPLASVKE